MRWEILWLYLLCNLTGCLIRVEDARELIDGNSLLRHMHRNVEAVRTEEEMKIEDKSREY